MFMIKRISIGVMAMLIVSCGPGKKEEPVKPPSSIQDTTVAQPAVVQDTGSSLEDLVYEGVGASTLKKETLARSQAEQKGRVAIMKALADDAAQLIQVFGGAHGSHVLTANADMAKYAKEASESLSKSATLRGSAVQEYGQSAAKDTTYATIEIPLMNGYEEIERVLVEVGQKNGYIKSVDDFRRMFREFFLTEKKKMLTVPG